MHTHTYMGSQGVAEYDPFLETSKKHIHNTCATYEDINPCSDQSISIPGKKQRQKLAQQRNLEDKVSV